MQTPSSAPIHAAIEVLKKFGEHINHSAANSVIGLPESQNYDQHAARIEARTIEQTTRIETVVAQLANWRDELRQERRPGVFHRV